ESPERVRQRTSKCPGERDARRGPTRARREQGQGEDAVRPPTREQKRQGGQGQASRAGPDRPGTTVRRIVAPPPRISSLLGLHRAHAMPSTRASTSIGPPGDSP